MNMQLRQCFARTKPVRLEKVRFCLAFFISKKSQTGNSDLPWVTSELS